MPQPSFARAPSLAATLLALAPCLHAQEATEAADAVVLRPVTVTVTPGVPQLAFDTPASIDVIGGAALRDGQLGVNVSESLVRAPGVTALNRQNYAQDLQVSIRGYGARSTFGVRGLRLYTDGIPATAPDGQGQVSHFDLLTADRLEVLRGPFSALYGNASGGVINLITADGGPDTVLEAGGAVGADGVQRTTLRASGQQGALQYNVGASRFDTDGARPHSAARRDALNAKLKWTLNEDTRLSVVANHVHIPDAQDPLGLTRAELQANPRQATAAATQFDTRKTVGQSQVGAIFEQRLSSAQSLKVTGWTGTRSTVQFQSIPVGTQAAPTSPGGVIDLDRSFSGLDAQWTLRTRALDVPLALTVGLTGEQLRENRQGFQNFIGSGAAQVLGVRGALRRDERNTARTFDQYAQGVWNFERWSLTAGLRHSSIRFESGDRYLANGDDSGAVRFGATTPVLGVVWRASPTTNLYASAGRGFETPTLNELSYRQGGAGLNFALQPARSRQVEAGVKTEFGEAGRLNFALFEARTSDEIAVLSNTGGRSTFRNAGRTLRQGVELSHAAQWRGGWSTLLSATQLRAVYQDAFLTCGPAPCAVPALPVAAGNRLPGIPRASLYGELAWAHKPWGLGVAAEVRHQGRMAVDDRNTDEVGASTQLALRATLEQKSGRWTLREFVRVDNATDRQFVGSAIVNEGNGRYFEPGPGRTWLLGVTASLKL
ncbi:TonB-dependent receptor family protein [Ramlibacter algicola]|uniref:TonB-dependent receptor n=1 Tax=Ramlibacter algicola TaxID=2795217 RepID=A0A934PZ17_9BURK|nr:TonB-dependent receptor [Ramlibacter algicola]MBK0392008.1 TonB-dependent receptor [Ramlibacter algicola]